LSHSLLILNINNSPKFSAKPKNIQSCLFLRTWTLVGLSTSEFQTKQSKTKHQEKEKFPISPPLIPVLVFFG
jgi:hypothetical protein